MGRFIHQRIFIAVLAVSYLFVALTHVALIQKSGGLKSHPTTKFNSIQKKQNISQRGHVLFTHLKRADKTAPEKNNSIGVLIKAQTQIFHLLFGFETPSLSTAPVSVINSIAKRCLSLLCCFRI